MFDEHGAFDVAAYEEGLTSLMKAQRRALVVLNTPCHNPTGYSLDNDEWTQVVEITENAAASGPVSFLLDFAYAKFAPPGQSVWREHVERLADTVGVFVAWTASKSFAQYGARIGALVALHPDDTERARIANALGYSCRGTWSNCNHLGMLAISELLRDPELLAASLRERAELCDLLAARVEVFNEHARAAGLSYPRYEGGFFVTVFTPDAKATAEHMSRAGVYVVPVDGAVRVALCATPRSRVPELVEALADGVRSVG
jgi:aspartate/tyrosine/aromatic aminotransferase